MLWCAKISAFTPKITRFLIVPRGAFLLLSNHAKNHLRCWTGSKSRQRPGRAHSKLFPATCREWTLRHCIQERLERSCAPFREIDRSIYVPGSTTDSPYPDRHYRL